MFFGGFAAGALAVTLLAWHGAVVQRGGAPVVAMAAPPKDRAKDRPNETQRIGLPIAGLKAKDIQDTFNQSRGSGSRAHEATDILSPRGTPVVAVVDGTIKRLFLSKPGGLTIYQFDPGEVYCYYYAHLDRYADGIEEGMTVKRGTLIGYVGSTGNADPGTPHLHFAIFKIGPEKHWWQGTPINPYPILMEALPQAR